MPSALGNTTDDCPTSMSNLAFVNGWLLIVGTIIAFLPQHFKISRRKSHIGVSPWFVVLAEAVSICQILNYTTLEWHSTFKCCTSDIDAYGCVASLLAFGQELTILACTSVLLFLYVYYYDHDTMDIIEHDQGYAPGVGFRKLKRGLHIFAWVVLFVILLDLIFIWQFSLEGHPTEVYGQILGVSGALLEVVLWFPQLITSWRLGHAGSFSVAMLVMQSIGAGMSYYNLRLHGNFYIWAPFLGRGTLELTLLLELTYLKFFTERGSRHTLFDLPPCMHRCWGRFWYRDHMDFNDPDDSLYDDLLLGGGPSHVSGSPSKFSKNGKMVFSDSATMIQSEYLIVQ
eukprot:gb/GEZN01010526.1/.p1 GENE.gb/GEZN01010526.1/~~gb/GEZN01010526.1/.p1  ORF type:complete len:342 (+),score=22.37 gb/GEZN01010526.1/:112-1137(+)